MKIPGFYCLECQAPLLASSCVDDDDDAKPKPGDVSVCIYCGHIMMFDNELLLRELTPQEQIEIAGDKRILNIQKGRQLLDLIEQLTKRKN